MARAAAGAGFAGLGISVARVDGDAVAAYAGTGLRCHEVLALVVSDDVHATVASAENLAERAASIGAVWVLTVFASPLTSGVKSSLRQCLSAFSDAGVGMAVEFSPIGPVSTIATGMDVVRFATGAGGRAGLMIDSWHFCHSDSGWDDLSEVPLDDIAYVQFADAMMPESEHMFRETLHRRALPGEGRLELDRFCTALLDRGWAGTVSVAVLSAGLRALPAEDLMRRLYEAAAPFWH